MSFRISVFLTRLDNNNIKAKAPSLYARDISAASRDDYLQRSLIPADFDDDNYDNFRVRRAVALDELAASLMA